MRRPWAACAAMVTVLALGLAGGFVVPVVAPARAAGPATITAVRAGHHPGFDRYVLQFDRSRAPAASVALVGSLVGDGSGLPVPVPGRAILRVVVTGAQAHDDSGTPTATLDRAFALPNVLATRGAGDFEGVVTLGIGLARRMPFHVHRLANPGRIAIDVSTAFARTTRTVYFFDSTTGTRRGVNRPIPDAAPAAGLLDRIFAGPTPAEAQLGLVLRTSGATGFSSVRVADRVARVRLAGQCRSEGNRFTIADEVIPTLRRLANVRWVKVYDPAGATQHPTGRRDSEPACLAVSPASCHYLVKDVQDWGDTHSGSFLVAHLQDGVVTGTTGAFYSEWSSVRGTVGSDGTALEVQGEGGDWRAWPQTWLPATSTFAGWTPVTPDQMRHYSGGGVPIVGQPCG